MLLVFNRNTRLHDHCGGVRKSQYLIGYGCYLMLTRPAAIFIIFGDTELKINQTGSCNAGSTARKLLKAGLM